MAIVLAFRNSRCAVSALFILVNSLAGIAGYVSNTNALPSLIASLFVVAALGGGIGSYLGSRWFDSITIKRFLVVVLLIAGTKLIFT